ncbi:MAG: serine/threonine-protein kinase [Gemmatimonadota bacterium]
MTEALERLRASLADRYRFERELGAGGMARVYLAQDVKHDRKVAVKVLRPELAAVIGAERFLAEIKTTANLQHPHILPLFDSGAADGFLYYVMPYIEGESLRDRLDREKQLPIGDAIRLATEVASALDYAHRRGVIHRDIKPANILLHDGSALVADFGIALAASRAGTRITETGMSLGTPQYMSPEQALGEREITARSDVYALGCVLYEMLLGEPPFSGPTAQAIVAKITTEKVPAMSPRRDTIPGPVEQAVLTALQMLPADRFGSTAEFASALVGGATASPSMSRPVERELKSGAFRLTEDVCRRLARASFDPRLIGTDMYYLDNQAASDVLVCFIAPCGRAGDQFSQVLPRMRYRSIAPTFRGFEPGTGWRPTLPLDDHIILVREFLRDQVARLKPRFTIIAGFSSGGDFAIRLAAAPDPDARLRVDGCLTLGANLSLETCFLTRALAALKNNDDAAMLGILRGLSDAATSLDEWVDVCEYVTRIVPTFRHDVAPLRSFGEAIVKPFEHEALTPFAGWYRDAAARGCRLLCVFEDMPMYRGLVRELQLRNLDEGILGEHYEEQSVVSVAATAHFDLIDPPRVAAHADALVARLRATSNTT